MWHVRKEINVWICIFHVFIPNFEISSASTNLINPFRVQNTQVLTCPISLGGFYKNIGWQGKSNLQFSKTVTKKIMKS